MFVDSNKIFKNKSQPQLSIPLSLVDYMNRRLPEGVKHIVDAKGLTLGKPLDYVLKISDTKKLMIIALCSGKRCYRLKNYWECRSYLRKMMWILKRCVWLSSFSKIS